MLLWLDLETTGLDSRDDHILEVAWKFTYDDLIDLAPGKVFSIATDMLTFDRQVDDYVRAMHTKTGLIDRIQSVNAHSRSRVEAELEADIDHVSQFVDEPVYLAGASVHFDLNFLRFWMPSVAKHLSHRVYDTSTLKAFFGGLGIEHTVVNEQQHSAWDDVEETLAVARQYQARIAAMLELEQIVKDA